MAFFTRFTQSVWQYVSPAKPAPHTRRKHTIEPSPPSSLSLLQQRQSMSPTSRVAAWHVTSPTTSLTSKISPTEPSTGTYLKRKRTPTLAEVQPLKRARGRPPKVSGKTAPVIKRPRGRPRKSTGPKKPTAKSPMADFDVDMTAVDDESSMRSEIVVGRSRSQSPDGKNLDETPPSWDEQDALDDTCMEIENATLDAPSSVGRGSSPAITLNAINPGSQVTVQDLSAFPIMAQPLILSLLARGQEPVLAGTWENDFPFLPETLFLRSTIQPPHIGSVSGSNFRAQKYFETLLKLGAQARDKALLGKSPDRTIVKTVQKYLAWTFRDANLIAEDQLKCPAILVTAFTNQQADPAMAQRILVEKLYHQECIWRHWLGNDMLLPCLYGVLVTNNMVVITVYEPNGSFTEDKGQSLEKIEAGLQSLGVFDFGSEGFDVWNALAIALLAVHVRDIMRGYAA
ncbi:hypothetical protein BDZ85DRAFT_256927 [Elsinoe ampelina]|uniref:Uncharacterized protein n=1 Tax=Elsinoe ampelina TaxID=302913 RepID=A0A6A6GMD0_9PEZI|nr:hypothetical protein BDZ85DRAFT_256927 [Elsinoe ampelina]